MLLLSACASAYPPFTGPSAHLLPALPEWLSVWHAFELLL